MGSDGDWHVVCRERELAAVGDFVTARIGRLPVLALRNPTGLRAFANVCRHRAHPVARGRGSCELLRCPYHGWTYGLDGRLRRGEEGEDAAASRIALPSLGIAAANGLVLVSAHGRGESEPMNDLTEGQQ